MSAQTLEVFLSVVNNLYFWSLRLTLVSVGLNTMNRKTQCLQIRRESLRNCLMSHSRTPAEFALGCSGPTEFCADRVNQWNWTSHVG